MKNIWKKNQVIIMALVIMIAVAGYLNFTDDKLSQSEETDGTSIETAVLDTEKNEWTLGEDSSTDTTDESDVAEAETPVPTKEKTDGKEESDDQELADISAEDTGEDSTSVAETDNTGEAVLVTQTIGGDFFQTQKLSREQTRAKNKETLLEIINNNNCTEKQKQKATKQMQEIIDASERESAAELLLEAKGFSNSIVTIVDDSVDVVVEASNLTMQEMAQIEDIVKRKTGVEVKNIVISPVAVKEQ